MTVHKGVSLWLIAGAIVSTVSLALAGCASSTNDGSNATVTTPAAASKLVEPTAPVTITYAGAAYAADQMKPIIAAFEKAHPKITVTYESVPFDDFNSVLAARLTNSSNAIDVFDVDMPRMAAYVARGWLPDLSKTFGDISAAVDPGSLQAATIDGKLVAMPYQTSTNLMYYNKKLLSAAGIAMPSADPAARLTWETVTQNAKKTQAAGAKYGLLFDQIDRYYQLEPLAVSAGGGPGGKGAGNLEPDINNAGWVKAFSWYGSLFADGVSPRGVTVAETPDMFAGGQAAYFVAGPWWAEKFNAKSDLDFGVTAFPTFAGGKASTPTGGWALGMNPKASAEKANAAAIFMKFMGLDNGGYAQYLSALAVPPSNLDGSKKFYDAPAFKDPRFAGAVDLMKSELANTATLRLQSVGYVEFESVMTKTFDDVINGTDAQKALAAATTDLTDAWAKFK